MLQNNAALLFYTLCGLRQLLIEMVYDHEFSSFEFSYAGGYSNYTMNWDQSYNDQYKSNIVWHESISKCCILHLTFSIKTKEKWQG